MSHTLDKPLIYATSALLIGGILILASSSIAVSYKNLGSAFYLSLRQLIFAGVGVMALFLTSRIPYNFWKKLSLPLMIISFVFLALLFIPELGQSFGGAKRWLALGFLTFQPSEFLKFSFIVYLASWLDARRQETATTSYGFIPFALMLSIVGIFLVMQPDIGTLGVIVTTAVLMYFLGGGRKSQLTTLFLFGGAIFYLLVQMAPYRLNRFLVFLNPGLDPQGTGYQINQALIAIGSGGFWGLGFGRSLQKYYYLPEPMGDSIFAVFAEEMGFWGALILISLLGFFFWRGINIAQNAPDIFGRLLASGLTLGIMSQALINMAAITGLLPLTGIPLPFVSQGGTALIMTLASVGVLLNISKYS